MTTKFYVDADGNYLGGFDGADPPEDAVKVTSAPADARQVWSDGAWGDVPEVFHPLTPRQFWLAALTADITEADVDAEIEAMDEPDRSEASINKNYAVIYERDSTLIAQLASSFGLTSDGVDSLWRLAETL